MTEAVLSATILVAAIGFISALILALASHFMGVKVDEKEIAIRECLPGANCGACGFSGCDGYAKALAEGGTATNLCRPGGKETAENVSAILGVEAEEAEPIVAFVHCGGDCGKNSAKENCVTVESCAAAKMLYGGAGSCVQGCLGCGDCAKVCTNDAICLENGIAHVDPRACLGCGSCAKACPQHIISIIPLAEVPVVTCSNTQKGAVVRKECSNGCIGCMKCQKNCPAEAITVVNNCATVDYSKCTKCGACVEGCPVKCLHILNA